METDSREGPSFLMVPSADRPRTLCLIVPRGSHLQNGALIQCRLLSRLPPIHSSLAPFDPQPVRSIAAAQPAILQ
jgi:hypothetical protein